MSGEYSTPVSLYRLAREISFICNISATCLFLDKVKVKKSIYCVKKTGAVSKSYRFACPPFARFPTRFAKNIKRELRQARAHEDAWSWVTREFLPLTASPPGENSRAVVRSASTHPNSILREPGGWPGVIRRRGVSRSRYRSVNPLLPPAYPSAAIGTTLSPSITISAMQPKGEARNEKATRARNNLGITAK